MLSIASHANREGKNAFPSLDTIAREALLSRREVIYAVQAMEELGELRVHRGIGRGNPNRYEMPLVEAWLQKVQRVHQLEDGKGATRKLKGANQHTKRCNDLALNAKESETSTLQPLEPSKARTVMQRQLDSLCVPEPSKPLSQEKVLQERDRQLTALREKGFIQ